MCKYILFSPIGGTDPIANERDGSMLHICRKYKPDCVMLYLSKEMVERHRRDDRYCDSLRRLAAQEGFSPEILVEERPKLSEVQVYDFFFQEFRPLLLSLHSRFPEHRLILNIASGTPAMKSALYLLAAFLPFPVLPVQTATPVKAQNPRLEPRMEYDVDLYWECNLDNEDYIDRCREGQYENLNLQLQKRNISAHLRAYDYAAALAVAEPIRALLNPGAVALLEAARARVELNWRSIKPEVKGELGLLGSSQRRIELAEYLLWLQMKQRRGDLADFLRGLTPGLFELLRLAAEEKAGYPLSSYCDSRGRFCRSWLAKDARGQEMLALLEPPGRSLDGTFLISGHYATILEKKCSAYAWAAPLLQLRKIEEKVRNTAAHTITRVDERWLKDRGVVSSQEVVKLLKTAVQTLNQDSGGTVSARLAVDWGAYDVMNRKIEAAL
ncbi:MAG: hypothetical protein HFF32_02700 [Flavonifractor sp.]|nr:hypothetical protein [Flavonifractor sp.]